MQTPLKGKIYKHLCKCVCVCVVYSRRIYINKLKKLSLRVWEAGFVLFGVIWLYQKIDEY